MIKLGSSIRACVILVFLCSVLSYGQSGSGTIKGTVLDPSGAAIKGANVSNNHGRNAEEGSFDRSKTTAPVSG